MLVASGTPGQAVGEHHHVSSLPGIQAQLQVVQYGCCVHPQAAAAAISSPRQLERAVHGKVCWVKHVRGRRPLRMV